jgi:S1-C subfamily serine protease
VDETTVRTLLDSVLAGEPPIGPVADNALRAGIKIRRRRVLSAAAGIAAAAAIAIALPMVTGPLGGPPASGQRSPGATGVGGPASVPPPDPAVVNAPGVARARPSVVKIVGTAASCSRTLEGSGFVFAPQHVLTNAHVVAGVRGGVTVSGHRNALHGTVVLYDPERDIAVIYVPGLRARPLAFASPPNRGDSAIVAGYPLNERFTTVPARIGSEQSANSPDIYQAHTVTRDIYAVRALVRPGNSGGPLLAPSGAVDGMVFAAAVDVSDTGYALTAGEVASDVSLGRAATGQVSTEACD